MESKTVRTEIDVPLNVLAFLEYAGNLTGRSVKETFESAVKGECQGLLSMWPIELCSVEELRERFNL